MFDLSMLMVHKQSYATVLLSKCCYNVGLFEVKLQCPTAFDMFTFILPNTFDFFQDHDTTR